MTERGRVAVLKRRRADGDAVAFETERASLELLAGAPGPIAPRLLGSDPARGLLLLEALPAGRSLADSLLGDDPAVAADDLVRYAEALGALGAWGVVRARRDGDVGIGGRSWWLQRLEERQRSFLEATAALGVAVGQPVVDEIGLLEPLLSAGPFLGFVHGDPCPDNVRIAGDRCWVFDFELASTGSIALDAGYLLAPFPSCWCFGVVPDDVLAAALAAHRAVLEDHGVELGDEWDRSVAAAVAAWMLARGTSLPAALGGDQLWGTTGMRSRLLLWSERAASGVTPWFPALGRAFRQLHDRLAELWPGTAIPPYPAFVGR